MHLLDTRLPKSGGFPLCYQLLFAFQSFLEKEINLASRKNATLNLILADVTASNILMTPMGIKPVILF